MANGVSLREEVLKFIDEVNKLEVEQAAAIKTRKHLEESIQKLMKENELNKEELDIALNAIAILRQVSDEAVAKAYKFLEQSLNAALERMFKNAVRKIRIKEYTRNGQYPQLEIELIVGNGKVRSLRSDSGHGIAQIVSLLSILCLIVLTNSRRILVMDEILSGISVRNRKIISDILWTFTQIGFQFIINEHGYVPKGAKVYHMEMVGDVAHVKETYIEEKGIYLYRDEEEFEEISTNREKTGDIYDIDELAGMGEQEEVVNQVENNKGEAVDEDVGAEEYGDNIISL